MPLGLPSAIGATNFEVEESEHLGQTFGNVGQTEEHQGNAKSGIHNCEAPAQWSLGANVAIANCCENGDGIQQGTRELYKCNIPINNYVLMLMI
jgi:hypothetical protein